MSKQYKKQVGERDYKYMQDPYGEGVGSWWRS